MSLVLFEECVAVIQMPNGETRCGEQEGAPVHNVANRGQWHDYQPSIRLAHNRSWPGKCRCGEVLHSSWKGYAFHLEEVILVEATLEANADVAVVGSEPKP